MEIEFILHIIRIHPAYNIVNVIDSELKIVRYWSKYSGLSVNPPERLYSEYANNLFASQKLKDVVWLGRTTLKPRGWDFSENGKQLRIAVPNRATYSEFR